MLHLDASQVDVGIGMLHSGQEVLEELTPCEENKFMSTDLPVITDEGDVSQGLNTLSSFVASDEVLLEVGVVKIVAVHCQCRHKIALINDNS